MRPYQKEDIVAIYRKLMEIASIDAKKRKWQKAIKGLSCAARWANHFNYIYTDKEAEELIKRISDFKIHHSIIDSPHNQKYVMIDSFCMDNKGLTQQYLRAMIHNQVEILYICTASRIDSGDDIIRELKEYPHAQLCLFTDEGFDAIRMANSIVEAITDYSPAHIFLHIAPWDVVALLSCASIKGSIIYNINLTDHAYWLGASLIDYNMEFRPYGKTVSLEQRGLEREQLLELPFFPIEPLSHPFRGLPSVPNGAIKILTGGAMYKMLGKNDIFFRMMEELLSISPNIYILVAGFSPSRSFEEKCKKIEGYNRILFIGLRDDIDAVFQNCDIFLSTYPTSGGLMCQYAAKYGKPILAYREQNDAENAVEEMVNHYSDSFQSHTDLSKMVAYAENLVRDASFRRIEGDSLKKGIITSEIFYETFADLMLSHRSSWNWNCDLIDYEDFSARYIDLENTNKYMATKEMLYTGGAWMIFRFVGYRTRLVKCFADMIKDAIFRKAKCVMLRI